MISIDELLACSPDAAWSAPKRAPARDVRLDEGDPRLERAIAAAKRLPPSVEGHGGDEALFRAASELSTILGEDARAIATVLREHFNPRCLPPWDDAKLEYEAARAGDRQSTPEARWAARRTPLASTGREIEPDDDLEVDWTEPAPPIEWFCKDLAIAPSNGKVTIVGGDPGAGKGPFADYLALHFATGLPVFGRLPVRRCNVGILDFEGAALTRGRIESHARGVGVDPRELQGRLRLREAYPEHMLDPELEWLGEWIDRSEIEVLVVDSYMSAASASGVDPNSPEYAQLARALARLGIVVIVVAHARKPAKQNRGERPALGDLAGSFALGGLAQTGLAVWLPDEDDRTFSRIGCMRAPDGPFASLDVRWHRSGTDAAPIWRAELLTRAGTDAAKTRDQDARLTALARRVIAQMALNPGYPQTANALGAALGAHHRDVGAILGACARARLAHHTPAQGGRGTGTYQLRAGAPPLVEIRDGEAVEHAPDAGSRGGVAGRIAARRVRA